MRMTPLLLLALSALSATAETSAAEQPSAAKPPAAKLAVAKPAATEPARVLFRDVAESAGVVFEHHSAPEKKYILESMAGGVALFDFDNDGRLDIYLVNSLTVDTADQPKTAPSALYRNLGTPADGTLADGAPLRFEEVAVAAGVAYPGWGMGACTADLDGDGWVDLYVTAVGGNHLYRNNGDGSFTDITQRAGVAAGGWSAGCAFADYDRDGVLDLFVSRYVEVDLENLPVFGRGKTCKFRGIAVQCGPRGLPGTSDLLYRGAGDGRFTEVGAKAGIADPDGYFGLGVAWLDFNDDGWLDLFVANDSNPNFFYQNQGDGSFEEAAFPLGVAVSEDGGEQGGMGVAVADYENNGRFGLFVTNFAEEYNSLYQNQKDYFTDVSFRSASAAASLPFVGWGTAFFDYDHDGWQDLMVVNGHVYPQLANANLGASASYRQRKLLYHSRGANAAGRVTFEEVAASFGPVFTEERVSRGLALGDLDNDGRLDVVINDLDGRAQVLHHELPGVGHWLMVKLEGSGKNTSAIGAVVTVQAGKLTQTRLVRSGTGYLSQDDMRQHFGLGTATKIDQVEVRWPDGTTSTRKDVAADQHLVIRQAAADG